MTRAWFLSLGVSLALTLAFELSFALLTRKRGAALLLVLLANLLTNPAVVLGSLLWRRAALPGYGLYVAAAELLAILIEGFVYRRKGGALFPRPYPFALAANAVSFGPGLVLNLLFH